MELFTAEFWSALLSIIMIDLVLAGDNAILIGLAAKNVPKDKQKKVIVWGTIGAIVIRAIATITVVYLLKIPGLLAIGGILLIHIAYELLLDDSGHEVKSQDNFWAAIKTIIIADALMGLDNVLAVAGAAHGSFLLVIIGLLVSIPIVVLGSTIILRFIEKFPIIVSIGSAILAYTSSKMITHEQFILKGFFDENPIVKSAFSIIIVLAVLIFAKIKKKKMQD